MTRVIVLWLLPLIRSFYLRHFLWASMELDSSFLTYILGASPEYAPSLDYFPLIPWSASISTGALLGWVFFKNAAHRYTFPAEQWRIFKPFAWLGRKAFLVYLIHFPAIILGVLLLRQIGML